MTTQPTPPKFPLTSMDIAEEKRRQLKQLFPEAFTEALDARTGELKHAVDWEKLKAGFPLTTKVEKIGIADKSTYSIAEGALIICLDAAFHENDQLKTNAVQTMESAKVQFRTV